MLTHTITLSFSLSTTLNSLWKRQVQTLIEPEPDLAPALSVRPAVLSNPLRSMSSQQAGSQASSQSTRLHPAGRGGLRLSPSPRYSRASLGSLGRPQWGIAQCQALSLHHWMCWGQDGEGTPNACSTSSHFPLTVPAKTTFLPRTSPLFLHPSQRLHLYWTLHPPPPPPPRLLPSFPRSIHLGATLIQVSLFSILHPPSPAVLQPTTVSYWFIDCCLPVGERPQSPSLPLLSPAWICLPFPLLSSPSLSSLSLSPHRCSSSETWIRESRGVQFNRRNRIHLPLRLFLLSLPRSILLIPAFRLHFLGVYSAFCFCQAIMSCQCM